LENNFELFPNKTFDVFDEGSGVDWRDVQVLSVEGIETCRKFSLLGVSELCLDITG
jgi:hypothetical protein